MPVEVGAHAPHVTMITDSKETVTVPNHGEVTVLAFFPAAFTGVCTTEMCTFRDELSGYSDLNAKVYGVSIDSPFALAEFKKQQNLNFPLLSDHKHEAIKAYDVVFSNLANLGFECAARSVFVIGKDGNVAWEWVGETPAVEPDYGAVKAAVEAAS